MLLARRNFLVLSAGAALGSILANCTRKPGVARKSTRMLQAANGDGLRLLPGFHSRIVAVSGRAPVAGSNNLWHQAPDGGAVFATPDGGWIYVSNSEIDDKGGGVGALHLRSDGTLVDAYSILRSTSRNCAGGATPWNTWLTCEEVPGGMVWECDPFGKRAAVPRPALGVFSHEAAAADEKRQSIYLTEDEADGLLYRYRPAEWENLEKGGLEALVNETGQLVWKKIPDPLAKSEATRHQLTNALHFDGGEGAWFNGDHLFFATKGDNRIWSLDVTNNRLRVAYDAAKSATPILTGVDNVVGDRRGIIFVAEDGGDMQLVALFADGRVRAILEVINNPGSEITGPAFDPSGTRLYFSSQRNPGITYEVSGNFSTLG